MYETNYPATIAILQMISAYDCAVSLSLIDMRVFYGFADRKILKPFLGAISKDGLLKRFLDDTYEITLKGRMFLEQNAQ